MKISEEKQNKFISQMIDIRILLIWTHRFKKQRHVRWTRRVHLGNRVSAGRAFELITGLPLRLTDVRLGIDDLKVDKRNTNGDTGGHMLL